MDEEELEVLYWQFDAMHKGLGEWFGLPTSERDAFKRTVKQALAEKDRLHANQISEVVERLNDDYRAVLIGHEKAYQQLMGQAVRFAEIIRNDRQCAYGGAVAARHASLVYRTVEAFLKERERNGSH